MLDTIAADKETTAIDRRTFRILGKPPVLFLHVCTEAQAEMFRGLWRGLRQQERLSWCTGRLVALWLEVDGCQGRHAQFQGPRAAVPGDWFGVDAARVSFVAALVVGGVRVEYLAVIAS